jgi:hypothetical protein
MPVVARSEALVCRRSLAGTVGSNPVGARMSVVCVCVCVCCCVVVVLSGGGLCIGPNVCVCHCDEVQP